MASLRSKPEYARVHPSSIVLIVERGEPVHHGLNRALLLARHLRAPLELFWCGRRPKLLEGQGSNDEMASADSAAQDYLQALRLSIASADVAIRSECAWAPSLAEGLLQKLQRTPARLVVRAVANKAGSQVAEAVGRSLLRSCSSPLLLARKRTWRPLPRFGAALDLGEEGDRRQCQHIAQLAQALAMACGALLEYLFVEKAGHPSRGAADARERLDALGTRDRFGGWLHYRVGDAHELLPGVIAERDYDLLMLGVSAHLAQTGTEKAPYGPRAGGSVPFPWVHNDSILDTLLGRLVQSARGDLLLVPKTEQVTVES